ncbi:helicase HerA-like domain-containing protein [Methylococcus sp. ANG]|uniref:ATP-binding protein n=1 Tax=Methylococcus sp. ANG TaxID=3231903 RepID=UPI003459E3D9
MDASENSLIGHLVEVRAGRFVARLLSEEEGFRSEVSLGEEAQRPGQVGAYVSVRHGAFRILALVREVSGGEAGSAAGSSMHLVPLGEFNDKGAFSRGVRRYPVPGAEVHAAAPQEINAVFARTRSLRFNPGYLPNHPATGVYLDPSALCSRHFAILGQSGAGKSWTVASLIQRMLVSSPKAHIILLDLHGEYCWRGADGTVHSAFPPEATRAMDARELEIPYWLMSFAELVDLLIERDDPAASIQTAFLREAVFELKRRSARGLGLEGVSIDAPVYFSLQEVYERFKEANEHRTDFGKTKGPLFGQFDEFLLKLGSRLHDVRYDFLLNPSRRNRSESLPGLLRDFVGLGEPRCRISVIDLSPVPFDVRPTVSAQIGRLAFEFNYWNPDRREFPILLVCEEAHAYIPREHATQYEGTRKSMERIAKEGRKYGVGLAVVSQRPHELSETVLSQCGSYICLRISNPDDQAYVRKLVPEGEADLVEALTALGRGEALILGETTPLPVRCQIFKPDPPPNSNDVDFHRAWNADADDLDVEAIVRRWWSQGR